MMSGFKEMVAADIRNVFLNGNEHAETRTVIYDGEYYEGIPVIILDNTERNRQPLSGDNAQGLYEVTATLMCSLDDLGGNKPEQGMRIKVSSEDNDDYYTEYYVSSSGCDMGMLNIKLGAIDE